MELLQLKYFKKVAETGKISTAAAALYISSPALSATISRLEREMGVQLFDRHSNRITLNRQGEIFLRYVNQVFISLECAKTELSQSLLQMGGQVQIAVSNAGVWMEMLSEFATAHPEIRLSSVTLPLAQLETLNLSGQYVFLLAEDDDVSSKEFGQQLLFEDQLLLMVHSGHPLADRKKVKLQEITGERLFLPTPHQAFNRRIREIMTDAGLSLDKANECDDMTCRNMVQDNRGVAFTTQYTDPDSDEVLRYIPVESPRSTWQEKIFWDTGRKLRPEEETFRSFAVEFYKNHKFMAG